MLLEDNIRSESYKADSETFDQNAHKYRLIWDFYGRTCHKVHFVMLIIWINNHVKPHRSVFRYAYDDPDFKYVRNMANIALSGQGLGSTTMFFPRWVTKFIARQVKQFSIHGTYKLITIQWTEPPKCAASDWRSAERVYGRVKTSVMPLFIFWLIFLLDLELTFKGKLLVFRWELSVLLLLQICFVFVMREISWSLSLVKIRLTWLRLSIQDTLMIY